MHSPEQNLADKSMPKDHIGESSICSTTKVVLQFSRESFLTVQQNCLSDYWPCKLISWRREAQRKCNLPSSKSFLWQRADQPSKGFLTWGLGIATSFPIAWAARSLGWCELMMSQSCLTTSNPGFATNASWRTKTCKQIVNLNQGEIPHTVQKLPRWEAEGKLVCYRMKMMRTTVKGIQEPLSFSNHTFHNKV